MIEDDDDDDDNEMYSYLDENTLNFKREAIIRSAKKFEVRSDKAILKDFKTLTNRKIFQSVDELIYSLCNHEILVKEKESNCKLDVLSSEVFEEIKAKIIDGLEGVVKNLEISNKKWDKLKKRIHNKLLKDHFKINATTKNPTTSASSTSNTDNDDEKVELDERFSNWHQMSWNKIYPKLKAYIPFNDDRACFVNLNRKGGGFSTVYLSDTQKKEVITTDDFCKLEVGMIDKIEIGDCVKLKSRGSKKIGEVIKIDATTGTYTIKFPNSCGVCCDTINKKENELSLYEKKFHKICTTHYARLEMIANLYSSNPFTFISTNGESYLGDPNNVKCLAKSKQAYAIDPTEEEKNVYITVDSQWANKECPPLDLIYLKEIDGLILVALTPIVIGTCIGQYLGLYKLYQDCVINDKTLTAISHPKEDRLNVMIDPTEEGGFLQFGCTAAPPSTSGGPSDDFTNCNCFIVGRLYQCEDDTQEVRYYMFAMNRINKGKNTSTTITTTTTTLLLRKNNNTTITNCAL